MGDARGSSQIKSLFESPAVEQENRNSVDQSSITENSQHVLETHTVFSDSTGENITGTQPLKRNYISDGSDPDPSVSVQAQASSGIITEATLEDQDEV